MSANANIAAHRDVPPFRFADKLSRQAARLTRKKWRDANELAAELANMLASPYTEGVIGGSSTTLRSAPLVIHKLMGINTVLGFNYDTFAPIGSAPYPFNIDVTLEEAAIVTIIQQPWWVDETLWMAVAFDGETLDVPSVIDDNNRTFFVAAGISLVSPSMRISTHPISAGAHSFSWQYTCQNDIVLRANSSLTLIFNAVNADNDIDEPSI